jgi:WD40 repeat protein
MTEKEFSGEAQAEDGSPELPTEPILRIETGKHGGSIRRIDTDAENRFAVTASHDKTVRVWSLPEGRPMRTLRLPLETSAKPMRSRYPRMGPPLRSAAGPRLKGASRTSFCSIALPAN